MKRRMGPRERSKDIILLETGQYGNGPHIGNQEKLLREQEKIRAAIVLLDRLREHFKMEEVPHSVRRHSEGG